MKKYIILASIAIFTLVITPALAVSSYFNGFETDISGWNGTIARVASGTDSITSALGSYHAKVNEGDFTRWGGYENVFPTNGYITKIDVYLDMAQNPTVGTDKRFDFSSAINQPNGDHRRDFIFSVGTDPAVANQWVMSASNNSPGWPANPGRDPFVISDTGWYTFQHTFTNNGGVLKVVMEVLNSGGTVLHSWTLSDPSDVIGTTVGGNRYGWFVTSAFSFLAVDNSEKINIVPVIGPPTKIKDCMKGGWKTFNNPLFQSQKKCIAYVVKQNKPAKATGDIGMSGPKQRIIFSVFDYANNPSKDKGEVEYWNFEYPGLLHYKTKILCADVDKLTEEARFMFQIPSGWTGLSGLYVVSYVKDNGNPGTKDKYGHTSTGDLNTAKNWCENGTDFSMYPITNGNLVVHN